MHWLGQNWEWIVLGFYAFEKFVLISPSKYDDILVDVVFEGLKALLGKGKRE